LTILETTAGQGTALGYRFEQLRAIIDGIEQKRRVALCIDTCHLFAAGYPIHTERGWESTMHEFESTIGFNRLAVVHVNDSRREFGSRVDRHEHIGKGKIGMEGFRMLMNDPRLFRLPKILETEKSEDMHEDIENMAVLRSLVS
jgi:deoxyribonuclease-4